MKTGKGEAARERAKIEKQKLDYEIKEVNFRDVQESDMNAQRMNEKDFNRLVDNIRRDGCLTTTPLICENEDGKYTCISGHHRIKAAIKAGINSANCIILKNIDESTRIRLQLAHNDIHGEPDEEIVSILMNRLNEIDITLVLDTNVKSAEEIIKEVDMNVPTFSYINICLVDQSRSDLVDMIMTLEKKDAENWLVTQEQYRDIRDLLTYAFDKGFKTPGQAFGKFLDIMKENKELITRK